MKKQERIELTALWYGGGYSYQLQENNIGLYRIERSGVVSNKPQNLKR
jgi:hypothetical protein